MTTVSGVQLLVEVMKNDAVSISIVQHLLTEYLLILHSIYSS